MADNKFSIDEYVKKSVTFHIKRFKNKEFSSAFNSWKNSFRSSLKIAFSPYRYGLEEEKGELLKEMTRVRKRLSRSKNKEESFEALAELSLIKSKLESNRFNLGESKGGPKKFNMHILLSFLIEMEVSFYETGSYESFKDFYLNEESQGWLVFDYKENELKWLREQGIEPLERLEYGARMPSINFMSVDWYREFKRELKDRMRSRLAEGVWG